MLGTHFITHPHIAGILVWLHDDTAEVTPVKQEKTRRLITVKMRQNTTPQVILVWNQYYTQKPDSLYLEVVDGNIISKVVLT